MTTRPTTAYNFTIDDASPLIKYEPANLWDDNVSSDVNLSNYFQSSYHYSVNATATASLKFTGTGVWVIGGRRSISGAYSVQIDSQPAQSFPANPRDVTQYRVLLGGVNGLPFGEHTIVVKNLATDARQPVLDIDSFIVETAAGNESGAKFSGPTVVDDAAPNAGITFSANEWATTSRIAPPSAQFASGTVHESNVNGASVEFSFEGRGVGVMGAVGPRNGNFRVELDGRDMGELSAKASAFHPQTPIWFASNLSVGQHKVKLTNTGSNGEALTIDSYQVFRSTAVNAPPSEAPVSLQTSVSPSSGNSASAPAAFSTPSADAYNASFSRTSTVPLGLIIGLSVGGLVFLCLVFLGILFYRRLRRKNAALRAADVSSFTQSPPGPTVAQLPTDETRWSTATAVDIEAGLRTAEKPEKAERAERASGWLRRAPKDKSGEPPTPPLPLQNYTPSPTTPLLRGPNPILGTGGYLAPDNMAGYIVPSPPATPAPTPAPLPAPPIIPVIAISPPKPPPRTPPPRTPPPRTPPPRTPLPPPPLVIGLPPRAHQPAGLRHGRTPSVGTAISGPSRGRSLTSHEIRRSRSAQLLREQTQVEATDEVLLLPPAPAGRFGQPQARESNVSIEFDLSAYTDPRTPTSTMNRASAVPAVPSLPREYAPYAGGPGSVRNSIESGSGQQRRPGMI